MKTTLHKFLLSLVLVSACLSFGCSSVTPVTNNINSPRNVDQVEVLYQDPQRPYEVIALISHEALTRFATVSGVIQKCRELAAKVGADAVIITSTYDQTFNTAAKASGKAIRWKR